MDVYVDGKGSRVVVSCGISNGNAYMVCRVKRSGSLQRIKSKFLPVRNKRKEAQEDLERYAQERGWQKETTDFTDQKKSTPSGFACHPSRGELEHAENAPPRGRMKKGTTAKGTHAQNTRIVVVSNSINTYILARWLGDHRRKAFITCEETCECWEVSEKIEKAMPEGI